MKDIQEELLAKSHHQNQLQLLSEEDSDQILRQATKEQFYPSQLAQSLYKPILAEVKSLTLQEMNQRLRTYEIQFQKTNFCNTFQKHCIKTDWESTVYQIKYGNFKTNLKIIVMKMEPKILCNSFLSKGNFGEVLSFQLQKNRGLALKNIKFKPEVIESLDLALRQVFMAKIFSALEFGPKFSKIFSYDAIIYEGNVQFAMEMCEKNYAKEELQNEINNKNLLTELKNMHKLRICHLDIKYQNIGWSPTFRKFIFLDFSFTSNIREPVGYKTMTKFLGTYNYCSPEMKKLFFLKQSSYIDLYYNDLYGLEKIWNDFAQNKTRKNQEVELEQKFKDSPPQKNTIEDNQAIVRYFEAKISIFEQKYDDLRQIIQKQRVLIKTFRKITQISESSSQTVDSTQFKILHAIACNNPQQLPQECETKVDQILLNYEMEKETKQSATSFFQTMLKICDSDDLFLKLWQEELWRERIFFFIDVYSNPDKEEPRKNLIKKIYSKIEKDQNKLKPASYAIKFRSILQFYSGLFHEKKNIIILEKILTYFSLLKDYASSQIVESLILQLWERQEKYDEYLRENFKYFIGKMAIVHRLAVFKHKTNIIKMKNLLEKVRSNPDKFNREFLGKIQKTIDVMIIIQNINSQLYTESWNVKAKDQIKQSLAEFCLGSEINQFLELIFFKKCSQSNDSLAKKKTFTNLYLQKCAFQAELQRLLSLSKVITYKYFLENEDFTKQFPLLYKTYCLSFMERESQKKEMVQILKDYLFMNQSNSLIVNPEYFHAICFSKSINAAIQEAVRYLYSIKIEKLNNLQKILNLKYILPLFLTSIPGFKMLYNSNVQKEHIEKLNNITTTLLELTSNLQIFQGKCQYQLPLLEVLNQQVSKDMFKLNHQILATALLLSKGEEQKALDFIFQAAEENQSFLTQVFHKNLFNLVSDPILERKIHSNQTKVLQVGKKYLQKSLGEYYLQQPKFVIHILQIYRMKQQFNQIITWVARLCQIIQLKNFPFLRVKVVEVVQTLIKNCSSYELQKLIKQGTSMKLKWYSNFPTLIYFLALAWFKLETLKVVPQSIEKTRFIIICAAFVDNLKQGHFRRLKDYITDQVEALQINQKNKPQKLKRTKKVLLSYNPKDLMANIRKKHISKLTIETIREQLRYRVKLIQKNKISVNQTPYLQLFVEPDKVKPIYDYNDT